MATCILVIEDNATNLELMVYLLQAFGYAPLTAMRGQDGVEIAQRESPDLILCDISMSGMDGYAVARYLKGCSELRQIPLVAVTALAMVGDRGRILASGFDGYVSKPIDPETFVQQVKTFLPEGKRLVAAYPQPVTETTPPSRQKPASAPSKRAMILAVDDRPENLSLVRSILEPSGYDVVGAGSVDEALDLARRCAPDLFLADVHMPGKTGFDLIVVVKADPALRAIPFVFISSTSSRSEGRRQGLSLGADLFLVRPIEPEALLADLAACLENRNGLNNDGKQK